MTDVETVVMDIQTPVHVASNHPGQERTLWRQGIGIKDAVPPVQTAASKIKKVKRLFLKRETKIPIFSFLSFLQAMSTAPKDQ